MRPLPANEAWIDLLSRVYSTGDKVSPRGIPCREVLGCQTRVDMTRCVVTAKSRKLGRKFLPAEAWWILTGRNDVDSIAPYSKEISKFSNDGYRFDGAYGPKIVDQLRYVCDSLIEDNDTRQAVINIWRENPRKSRDLPCTTSLQFFIRKERAGRKLHCIDTMRSSDCWLGWPYDIFNMSMASALVLLTIRERDESLADIGMGHVTLTAASQHVYESNFSGIEAIFNNPLVEEYEPFDLAEFPSPRDLLHHLELLKDRQPTTRAWLTELT